MQLYGTIILKASKKDGKDILMKQRKLKIQNEFRSRLGLLVDMPKQGFESSNNGNTARRFFKNYKISAEITSISENLIYQFYVILQCLSSGQSINIDNLKYIVGKRQSCTQTYTVGITCHQVFIRF